jgi:hypothetical protein
MTGEQLHADVVAELFWDPKAGSRAGRRIPFRFPAPTGRWPAGSRRRCWG